MLKFFSLRQCFPKGLILTEALIAITTLTAGAIAMGSIVNNAISTTMVSKDYLIAQNLVTEGEEAVKVIRATNWMKKPDKKDCWLTITTDCSGAKASAGESYVAINKSGLWQLEDVNSGGLDLTQSNVATYQTPFRLYLEDIGGFKQYVASKSDPNFPPSRFFRAIKFANVDSTNNTQATFEVKVQWLDGSRVRTINRELTIYNYL